MAGNATLKVGLERALEVDDEGLVEAINELWREEVEGAAEAEVLVQVLGRFPVSVADPADGASALETALGWCANTESKRARRVLERGAPPQLLRIFDALIDDAEEDAKLFNALIKALGVMALFEVHEGANRMLRAAQVEDQWENDGWDAVYGVVLTTKKHAWVDALVDGLKDEIPGGMIGILFLDLCTLQSSAKQLREHPFNSPLGIRRMTSWLNQEDEGRVSYAISTCAALAFLPESLRAQLLEVADQSPEPEVRIAASKARIEANDESGFDQLKEIGNDPRYAMGIINYLLEHNGPPGRFPERFSAPGFKTFLAKATLCEWLSHPAEFGRPPQKLHKIDSRKIYWPPSDKMKRVYLFRYEYPPREGKKKPTVGVGMVGGEITFSLFDGVTEDMAPEEIYALHCAWELEILQDERAPKKRSVRAGLRLLSDYNEGFDD